MQGLIKDSVLGEVGGKCVMDGGGGRHRRVGDSGGRHRW